MKAFRALNRQIVACQKCPRLLAHCQQIAGEKRRAYRDWDYWAQPVPNFGAASARLLIVGLAPAAHGANRTGRMFTGDRSGDWLYRALCKAGFANQSTSTHAVQGLTLSDCPIPAVCHCAPPENKPLPEEIANCQQWLGETMDLIEPAVLVALGQVAWKATVCEVRRRGWLTSAADKFGHAAKMPLAGGRWLLASYHPSQQNTFTGKLTEPMFDAVIAEARRLLES